MKYSKSTLILYGICFLKVVCTVLLLTTPIGYYIFFLTIIALPIGMLMALYEKLALLCFSIVIITIALWLSGILLSIMGIKFKKLRKASIIVFTLATIVDLLTVFLSPNFTIIISCSVVSVLTLIVCIWCLLHKETQT